MVRARTAVTVGGPPYDGRMPAARSKLSWDRASPAPIVLVSGAEQYLADRAGQRIRSLLALEDPALEVHDIAADLYSAGELLQAASPSLFGEARLVRIDRAQSMNDAFLNDALTYLEHPAEGATVVIRHTGGNRGKKLLDALRAHAATIEVDCAAVKFDSERLDFVRGEFRAEGRRIGPEAASALVDAFSSDLAELGAACRQLMQDIEGDITLQHVRQTFAGRVEADAFDVVNGIVAGDLGGALVAARRAVASGADPVPIIAAIAWKFRSLAKVSGTQGGPVAGLSPRQADGLRRDLRRWNDASLGRAIQLIAAADEGVKGRERDPHATLERTVRRLAQLAR